MVFTWRGVVVEIDGIFAVGPCDFVFVFAELEEAFCSSIAGEVSFLDKLSALALRNHLNEDIATFGSFFCAF